MKEKIYDAIETVFEFNLRQKLDTTKPTHGPCCTCQDCGHAYDGCVCYHNEMVDKLNKWFERNGIK